MAGHHDGEGVFGQGLPHGAQGRWPPYLLGNSGIALGLAIGDRPRRLPYCASKWGGICQVELIAEGNPLPAKISLQPMGQVAKGGGVGICPGQAAEQNLERLLRRGLGQCDAPQPRP